MSSLSDPDFQALQGTWEQTRLEDSGVLNPADAHSAPGAITTISGDRFEVRTVDGAVLLKGRFLLDSTTTPKSITWVDAIGDDAGKYLPASYRLEQDEFVFIAADEHQPRPHGMSARAPAKPCVRSYGVPRITVAPERSPPARD